MVRKFTKIWGKVPRFIRRDFVRKMLAVVLAGIVYWVVTDRLSSNQEIQDVPLTISVPQDYVILNDKKPTVTITVSGSSSHIKRLTPNDFYSVNLEIQPQMYSEGKPYVLFITPDKIHAPFGVKVKSVNPERIMVDIDRLITQDIEVKAKYNMDSLAAGYTITKKTVTPPKVRVTAPSMLLSKLNSLTTKPIDLERMTQDFDCAVDYQLPVEMAGIKISPAMVLVQTKIEPDMKERDFSGLHIHLLEDDGELHAEFINRVPATVMLRGKPQALDGITERSIRVFADASGIHEPCEVDLPVICLGLPDGVSVVSHSPKKIKVKFKK